MEPASPSGRLHQIPVRVEGARAAPALHGRRRLVQSIALLLVIALPLTGMLRIDPQAGALVILDRQVWFADFFLISGLWIMLATGLVFLYSAAGTVFCGWVCPQNSAAEWANWLTRRLLGKRAEVSLDGAPVRVTASRQGAVNWILLALAMLGAALALALVPLLYFYPPGVVFSFVLLRPDPRLAHSLYWIYTVFVLIVLLDVTVLRHFWCRFICIYRVWQHSFTTRETLHVSYDASRAEACAGCNYCVTQCFIDLDPRTTDVFDSCINCGECIDACDRMHRKSGTAGLLRFEFGARRSGHARARAGRSGQATFSGRVRWALPFALGGFCLFVLGLWRYEPFHLAVDHGVAETAGAPVTRYEIALASKRYSAAALQVSVEGLAPGSYRLERADIHLLAAEHTKLHLDIQPGLPRGLYPVRVRARSEDGWVGESSFVHLASHPDPATQGKSP
jgi:polyferredoxin